MKPTDFGKYWDVSWNPIIVKGGGYHCTKISPGCLHCWAEQVNKRFWNGIPYDNRHIEFEIDEKVLARPSHWKKERTIFVCDLCDIFHEQILYALASNIHNVIENCPNHRFLVLTKRPQRAEPFYLAPIDNLWLGVTVCNQQEADEKIPILLSIPAAHRWISIEPILGKIPHLPLFESMDIPNQIDLVVVGAESGAGRRPCKLEWVESIVNQGYNARIPVFVKQLHINGKLSKDMAEWPEHLRVRQLPWKEASDGR